MDAVALVVTVTGVLLIAGVCLYFFAPRRAAVAAARTSGGVQEVRIRVAGGYEPATIEVESGRPVRLVFHREEVEGCSDTVLIPEWKIAQRLPAWQDTAVEFTPQRPGTFEFTCGMHMLRGTIRVT
jgi:plastocyanin domain-containing protein